MISVLELFGGVGLFLFGMSLMGKSLEKLAGSGLEKILQSLTTSRIKGVGILKGWVLGLGVTGIIQSSAATTIMLIGFVNAGIMTLTQAIPVVFGANVGSTVTAQILRLGDLQSGNIFLQLLKPSSFAPMLLAVGAMIYIFTKNEKKRDVSGILIGLGTLFYGMTKMEEVFAPLKGSAKFQEFFTSFNNPFLGILTGLVLTAIIQSSSASVGILQALSATGSITYGTAVPIIIGQNIGKCMTIILGGIGANKKAKRVAMSYLLFNIFGAVLFTTIIYIIYYTVGIPFFTKTVNRGDIANIHLLFNLIISFILLPLTDKMSSLTGKILRDTDEVYGDSEIRKLDDMLLKTPGIALTQCRNLMKKMEEKIRENFAIATGLITSYDKNAFNVLNDNESFIDRCETALSEYIVRIDRDRLTIDNKGMVVEMLNSVSDHERVGDYCMSIAYTASEMNENGIAFSPAGQNEMNMMKGAAEDMMNMTFSAFGEEKYSEAYRVLPLADTVGALKDTAEAHHVDRLQDGDCGVAGGVALYDLVNSYERISMHLKAISKQIIRRSMRGVDVDARHGELIDKSSDEFVEMERYYREKYLEPVINSTYEKDQEEENTVADDPAGSTDKNGSGKKNKSSDGDSKQDKKKKDKDRTDKNGGKDKKKKDKKKDDNKNKKGK